MQIVSGYARGIILEVVKGDAVRPTAVRARKSLFDSMAPWEGKKVLDLFSGSGALGLEAASRGASQVYMVEQQRRHAECIERNLAKVRKAGVEAECEVRCADVLSLTQFPFVPDVIFADPPYPRSREYFEKVLQLPVFQDLPETTLLVWEIPDTAPEMKGFTEGFGWKSRCVKNCGSIWFLTLFKGRT